MSEGPTRYVGRRRKPARSSASRPRLVALRRDRVRCLGSLQGDLSGKGTQQPWSSKTIKEHHSERRSWGGVGVTPRRVSRTCSPDPGSNSLSNRIIVKESNSKKQQAANHKQKTTTTTTNTQQTHNKSKHTHKKTHANEKAQWCRPNFSLMFACLFVLRPFC